MNSALSTHVAKQPRQWGDGVGDSRTHVIEDISYTEKPNFIRCRCGSHMTGVTPYDLSERWLAHGGKTLQLRNSNERQTSFGYVHPDDLWLAWAPSIQRSLDCTCPPDGAIHADCPNFLNGDDR